MTKDILGEKYSLSKKKKSGIVRIEKRRVGSAKTTGSVLWKMAPARYSK